MARSIWKGPYTQVSRDTDYVWSRASCITPDMVGHRVLIHNGKSFVGLTVTQDMVGHRYGEFAATRRRAQHRRDSGKK